MMMKSLKPTWDMGVGVCFASLPITNSGLGRMVVSCIHIKNYLFGVF